MPSHSSHTVSVKASRFVVGVILLPAAIATVGAQQPIDTARLTPVIVTASRTGTAQHVATSSTTVLHGDALRARGIETVAAALRELPSATVAQTGAPGSQTSLFLRGGEADYVQVMIDGVTVNEPGGAFNFANLSLDNVERIEVVRGPASVLYGANAVAGVVQIFTRTGDAGSDAELRVRAGQRGLVDAEASMGRQTGAVGIRVGAGHHASSGIHTLNNDWRSSTASGQLRFTPLPAAAITMTGRYADATFEFPTEYYGAPLDSNSYSTERRLTAGVDLLYTVRPAIDVRVLVGMSRLQNRTNDPVDQRTDGSFDDGSAKPFETISRRRNAEAQLDMRFIPQSTFTLGAEYDWQWLDDGSGVTDSGTDTLLPPMSRGLFAQLVGNVGSRLSYSLGARNESSDRFGSLESIRGGLGISVTGSTTLRASGGTAFKEPQFFEITGGGFATPNPGLDPERSTGWEAGVEQRLAGDALSIGVTYFDQRFRDMILFVSVPQSTGYMSQYRNVQAASSRGWEFEARARLPMDAAARASYSLLDATFGRGTPTPGAPLPRRASRSGALVLTVPFLRQSAGAAVTPRGLLTADATYTGPRRDILFLPSSPFSRPEILGGYTLVGVGAAWMLPALSSRMRLDAMVRADNLLDKTYQAVAGFATPRRTLSVGLRAHSNR